MIHTKSFNFVFVDGEVLVFIYIPDSNHNKVF